MGRRGDGAPSSATTLGCEVRRCEDFGALEKSPKEACLEGIRWAEAVVLLLGDRYGGVLPSGISATHEEYREARMRGTALAFVQTNADYEPDQRELMDEAREWQSGLYAESFSDPAELQAKVTRCLHGFTLRQAATSSDAETLRSRALSRIPDRSSASLPLVRVAVAVAPEAMILQPLELQDAAVRREIQVRALLGANPILDPGSGNTFQLIGDSLDLVQSSSGHVAVAHVAARGCPQTPATGAVPQAHCRSFSKRIC